MPKVGKKKFPYTKAGEKAATAYAKKTGKKKPGGRGKRGGKAPGRPLTSDEKRYYSGKRVA